MPELENEDKEILLRLKEDFADYTNKDLIKYVYNNYPYYAINSTIAHKFLTHLELEKINNQKPTSNDYTLFTVGYEGKTIDEYLNCLILNNIKILCDVRKNPISMKYGFSKNQLKTGLDKLEIRYEHLPELGIESAKRKKLNNEIDYIHLFKDYEENTLPAKGVVLNRLYELFLQYKRVALTCFENKPQFCHRHKITDYYSNQSSWNYNIVNL